MSAGVAEVDVQGRDTVQRLVRAPDGPNSTIGRSERTLLYVFARAALIVVASVSALAHVWQDLADLAFRDEESSHIAIAPVVFVWLVWVRRDRFRQVSSEGQLVGLLLLILGVVVHEVGIAARTVAIWHISALVALLGGFCLSFGTSFLRLFAPAILSLAFLIPVPGLIRQELSLPLQYYSAMLTEVCLSNVGMDVTRSGCLLSVNGTQVLIAEACNGMRMLFSVMLVVYGMFFSLPTSRLLKIVMCMLSPLAALLLNTVRLILTAAMYGSTEEQWAKTFHDVNGWLIPIVIMATLIVLTSRIRTAKVKELDLNERVSWTRAPLWNAVFAFLLGAMIIFSSWRPPDAGKIKMHHTLVANAVSGLPWSVGDWVAVDGSIHEQETKLLRPNAAIRRHYRNLEDSAQVTVAIFASSHARDLIGHEPGICLTGQGWEQISARPMVWEVADRQILGRLYEFRHPVADQVRKVASILLVPTGESSGDPSLVAEAASDFRIEPFGAVAIQLGTFQELSAEEWESTTSLLLASMSDIFSANEKVEIW